ncbi:hypothetical protein ACG9XS_20915 [Acinetobacter gyllenbergii]|uniref:hypothetical protein n=1 Tax=Acinetobacter gyllenbergii TaxID=134534 RepID=UPI0003BFCDA5|nr:hypothetical protein [Acinetobacter gyllenbergii]ESK35401.1 hypothetical protein F987_04313 [Acinetobacter gyllenbergii NIPH 230]
MSLEDENLNRELAEAKKLEEKRLQDKSDLVSTVKITVKDDFKNKETFSTVSTKNYDPVAVDAAIHELENAGYTIVKDGEKLRVTWENVTDES